jgi:predicted heme/steroid binding protein
MTWVFRKGDTRRAKVVQLVLYLVVGIALIGLVNYPNVMPFVAWHPFAMVLGLVMAVVTVVALARDTNPANRLLGYGPVKRLALLVLSFPMAWTVGYWAVWLGLPTMWAYVAIDTKVASVSVSYVWRERIGRGCHYRIDLAGRPLPQAISPCVSEAVWSSVQTGSTVQIRYSETPSALFIHEVSNSMSP